MHGPTLDPLCEPQPGRQVRGEDRGAEAVLGIVCAGQGFGFGGEGEERDGRAEGFGVVKIHFAGDAFDDEGAHAGGGGFLGREGTGEEGGAFGDGVGDEGFVFRDADGGDETGGGVGGGVEGRDGRLEVGAEGGDDGFVGEDALG